jgi:hypothetical protein
MKPVERARDLGLVGGRIGYNGISWNMKGILMSFLLGYSWDINGIYWDIHRIEWYFFEIFSWKNHRNFHSRMGFVHFCSLDHWIWSDTMGKLSPTIHDVGCWVAEVYLQHMAFYINHQMLGYPIYRLRYDISLLCGLEHDFYFSIYI